MLLEPLERILYIEESNTIQENLPIEQADFRLAENGVDQTLSTTYIVPDFQRRFNTTKMRAVI